MTSPAMRARIEQHYAATHNVELQAQQQLSNAVAVSAHCLLKIHEYSYGGREKNRQIRFFRPGGAETMQAQIFASNVNGPERLITTLPAHQISVKKMQEIPSFLHFFSTPPPEVHLSQLAIAEQDALLHKEISVDAIVEEDGPSQTVRWERVVHLHILEPK
jgi:hypothetical protein